jgi:GNAT superfamily N-acetyltransferase
MEINIVEATENDLVSILDLYKNVLDKGKQILTLKQAIIIFKKMSQYPDYHLYIAKIGEEIVGSFALLIMDNLAHFGTPSAIVEDVVVAENYQNKGIGKKMMEFAMVKAKALCCYKMALSSNIVRIDAHRFYESIGFEKHGFSFKINLNS